MTSSEEGLIFKLLDDYSRTRHHCFLAEMFLDRVQTEYFLCFRPTSDHPNPNPSNYACRYLRVEIGEVQTIDTTGKLTASIIQRLDADLPSLATGPR